MSTTYHPEPTTAVDPIPQRSSRCLRHHVWMAACDDCRDAHAVPRRPADAGR